MGAVDSSVDSSVESSVDSSVDTTVAAALSRKVRLACFITTREVHSGTKPKAVNETWGKRCDKFLYVMTTNKTRPDILGVTISDYRAALTEKVVHAFTPMYTTSLDKYDWFIKADDDTLTLTEAPVPDPQLTMFHLSRDLRREPTTDAHHLPEY
ncbi:glycoprotein-N-acetylgalactosamine 3-beta-galactosyltransferase 1-like [Haliotis rufescens]|uniref:glycoprotein-N-acetylgalactosamine 3-beta-galactosyltransferase 1-like n=1 Tax=Haliotis rufescens TaxID=6454 RepID=UPI00201EA64C|nr:glycoprotein-N-acetylgalactosamine 3-beta-galactosyltransferase 1-like [Haliotis rufescens]